LLDHKTNRLIATSKLKPFLSSDTSQLSEGQQVMLQIWQNTSLGFKAVVDKKYEGLLYHEETGPGVQTGDELTGFIHRVREDGKLDLRLNTGGRAGAEKNRDALLELLKTAGGQLALTDKSSPDEIMQKTGMSKKAFKKALGNLYRERKIIMDSQGIRLHDQSS
jgi:predicted RNA-binding protein (virulence factor B family)